MSGSIDDLDDAFSEWDETTPVAQLARGSRPYAMPAISRTVTRPDAETTARLAKASRRMAAPQNLEEALQALANDGSPELVWSGD